MMLNYLKKNLTLKLLPLLALPTISLAPVAQADLSVYGKSLPEWEAGVEGGIPTLPVITSVTDHGAIANDGLDDSAAFIQALTSLGGAAGAVEIPAGTFNLNASIDMPDGAVLRGAGADQTHLILNHSGQGFTVEGWGEGTSEVTAATGYPAILSGADKGSKTINLDDASSFAVGDGIELVQAYDPSVHETQAAWDQSWAKRLIGQFSVITAKNGNQLTLADAIRIDMDLTLGAWAAPVYYATQVGFEDFTVSRADTSDTYIFYVKRASNVWAKGVKSQYAAKGHYYLSQSRRIEVRDSWLEFASNYGGGGHGYGVEILNRTSGSLVVNNVFNHLRHSMMLHLGANGNVLAYNFSTDPYQDQSAGWEPPDVSLHGHYAYSNLVESNIVAEIGAGDYWGPIGPDNLMFRNTVTDDDLHSEDYSDHQLAVGNRFLTGTIDLDSTIDSNSWVLAANHSDSQGDLDNTAAATANLPASYYYASAPTFMTDYGWPATGADLASSNLPAQDAFVAGVMPSAGSDSGSDTESDSGSGSETDTETGTDSGTGTDSDTETDPDPELATAPLSCTTSVGSNWSSGNVVYVTLVNTSAATTVTDWTISLLFADDSYIAKLWSATWIQGSPDQAAGLSWNSELAPGDSTEFGFKVQKGSSQSDPVIPELLSELCQ